MNVSPNMASNPQPLEGVVSSEDSDASLIMEAYRLERLKRKKQEEQKKSKRKSKRHRIRPTWAQRMANLTPLQFQQRYRMPKEVFNVIFGVIKDDIKKRQPNKTRSGPPVEPEMMLSIALRMLAGGSYHDIADAHGIHESTINKYFWDVVMAINNHFEIGLDPTDEKELKHLEIAFRSKSEQQVMEGCCGVVDGILCKITPRACDTQKMKYFHSRKGFYSVNMQGMSDAYRRFLHVDIRYVGAASDKRAFGSSPFGLGLKKGLLVKGYWIGGDNAYHEMNRYECFLTPIPGQDLDYDEVNYNFYFRQLRIIVECAFGALVGRFGLLWKSMRYGSIERCNLVIQCLCKLHNIITNWKLSRGGFQGLHVNPNPPTVAETIATYKMHPNTSSVRHFEDPKVDKSGKPIELLEVAAETKKLVDSAKAVGVYDRCRKTGKKKTHDPPQYRGPSPVGLLNDNFNFETSKQAVYSDLMRAKILAVKSKGLVAKQRRGW